MAPHRPLGGKLPVGRLPRVSAKIWSRPLFHSFNVASRKPTVVTVSATPRHRYATHSLQHALEPLWFRCSIGHPTVVRGCSSCCLQPYVQTVLLSLLRGPGLCAIAPLPLSVHAIYPDGRLPVVVKAACDLELSLVCSQVSTSRRTQAPDAMKFALPVSCLLVALLVTGTASLLLLTRVSSLQPVGGALTICRPPQSQSGPG